ncbi:MAG: hypothetical protein V4754_17015 [Pseudomonadota bacterium]
MKILKNMEIIFTVAAGLACAASYVSFMERPPAGPSVASTAMPVVVVTGKRLTPQEKAAGAVTASGPARSERDAMLGQPNRRL